MSITSILICLSSILVVGKFNSVPPSLCFEPFNGLDCGGNPLHVLHYYKPGSRCEIAIWRGCPTRNKFQDEYECVNTCIFTERARYEEHHNVGNEDDYHQEPYEEVKKAIDEPATTTISADSGYEADDEGGGNGAVEKDTKEADGEEKADENAATENVDGENADEGENAAEADNENVADEANKEADGDGDEEKIEATSEGTMELGSEDIGAN